MLIKSNLSVVLIILNLSSSSPFLNYFLCDYVTMQVVTLAIILLVLSVLTQTFYFIPNAALSAIIWLAINSLIDFTVIHLHSNALILSLAYHKYRIHCLSCHILSNLALSTVPY